MSAQPIRRWDQETALLAWLAALRFDSFLSVLSPARRNPALRRRGGAHQHCAPRFRFPHSGPAATGDGLAAAAPPADDSVSAFQLDVEDGSRRIDSVDGRLRLWRGRDFPAGARRAGLSLAVRPDDQIHRLAGRDHLCRQSEPDLPASHGHDRTALPGAVHLGHGVLQRIRAGVQPARRKRASACQRLPCSNAGFAWPPPA